MGSRGLVWSRCRGTVGVSDLGQPAQRGTPLSREASPPGTPGTARSGKGVWLPVSPARVPGNLSKTAYPGGSTQSALVPMPGSSHKAVFSACQIIRRIWESLRKSEGREIRGPTPLLETIDSTSQSLSPGSHLGSDWVRLRGGDQGSGPN